MKRPHPGIVLISATVMLTVMVLIRGISNFVAIIAIFTFLSMLLRLPAKQVLSGLGKSWPFLIVAGLIHFALSSGSADSYYYLPRISFTFAGLMTALLFTARLGLIIAVSTSLFLIYDAQRYGREMGRLAGRLPIKTSLVSQAELVLTLAIRFVPFVQQEYSRLQLAFAARGLPARRGLTARFRRLRVLLVPLLLCSIRRADHVAIALEARGYNPEIRRTAYHSTQPETSEIAACVLVCALCVGTLWL